jgi:uncharacterized protein YndB with AHSA1/START domain
MTEHRDAALDYGSLHQLDDERWQLRFTRVLPHSRTKVWRAITEPEHLADWFPTTIEGERVAGAALRFSFENLDLPPFDGEMIEFVPEAVIEFRWGTDLIRIELRDVPAGTELSLNDTLGEHGKAARDGAGWHTCLDALASSLQPDSDPRATRGRWAEVHPRYIADFGPEAATIGPPEGLTS